MLFNPFSIHSLSLSIKSSTLPKIATDSPLGTTAELCCNNLCVYVRVCVCVCVCVCTTIHAYKDEAEFISMNMHVLFLQSSCFNLTFNLLGSSSVEGPVL